MYRTGVIMLAVISLAAGNPYKGFNAYKASNTNVEFMSLKSAVISHQVVRLDLSGKRITGENAVYFMDIPSNWAGYMTADRESALNGSRPLERLRFYYKPLNKSALPDPLLTISIYSINDYVPEQGYHKLFETTRYVFTVKTSLKNDLENKTDKAICQSIIDKAKDPFLTALIRLGANDEKYFEKTIWVNGVQLDTKALTDSNIVFLPIREVCENLGYLVNWIPDNNAISISKDYGDKLYRLLILNDITYNKGYSIRLINNRTYISSLYFATQLGASVEVDSRYNVTVNEY